MAKQTLYVDSDNAMGSPSGDVDDGFAIAALLRSNLEVAAIGSVFGNTSAKLADQNNRRLGKLCDYSGEYLRGAELGSFLAQLNEPINILALGPFTNIAAVLRDTPEIAAMIKKIICVGSNSTSKGRWPPFWPFEYNFTKDKAATRLVFESDIPVSVVPLDIAQTMRARFSDLVSLPGEIGEYLRSQSKRWFTRAKYLKAQTSIPVWDLVAAMYLLEPSAYQTETVYAQIHHNAWLQYGKGKRELTVVTKVEIERIWNGFIELLDSDLDSLSSNHRG